MHYVSLSQAVDANVCGGKAANLARSISLGFQVPEGFVLPRSALRLFLETNQLVSIVRKTLDAYEQLEWPERQARFETLRTAALKQPIPNAIQAEIEPEFLQWLERFPAGVAIRSSGVCEDLQKASFAGIYDSFLGVNNVAAFWKSIIRCWCSMWSPKALAYAHQMGIELPLDGMAVLVQRMIPAESSGVIFTADPASGDPWQFVLNATFGLAAGLVDGSAPADRFVLAWDTGQTIDKRLDIKPKQLVVQNNRINAIRLPVRQQPLPSLTEKQAQSIGQMALAVDRAFDQRMDLEWAIANNQLYLLQARPLTALPAFFPHELSVEDAAETWTPYLNGYGTMNKEERLIAPYHRHRWLLELWNYFLTPDDIFPHRSGQERDFNGYRYTTEWKWYSNQPDWSRIESWLDLHEPRLRLDWIAQLERVRQANAWLDAQMAGIINHPHARAVDWLRLALAYEREEYQMQAVVWYAPQWLIFTCEELLKRFSDKFFPNIGISDLPAGLLQGLHGYSVERTIAAQALGRNSEEAFVRNAFAQQKLRQVLPFLLRRYPSCLFLQSFTDFCLSYGMEPPALDGTQDTEGLDIEGVLLVIKSSILGRGADAKTVFQESASRRQAVETQAIEWLRQNQPDQLVRFIKLLGWAQFWSPALDNRKWHLTMSVRIRKLYQHTKTALVAEGLIEQPDHFFLLTTKEWAGYLEHPDDEALISLYRNRKDEYERNRRLEPLPYLGKPPAATTADPELVQEAQTEQVDAPGEKKLLFRGEGIAPGKARGIAHQIDLRRTNLDEMDQLTNEHILICGRDTFNAQWKRDWYSLFMIVRGLVTVQGAQLHHATQIARECGVPFINLPGEQLRNLPDGQMIEIDGQEGTLRAL